jgi:hypothetical protein
MPDLDRALRDLLTDERLDVPVRPDATGVIKAGVRRRRRNRAIAATTTALIATGAAVAAAIVVPAALDANGRSTTVPATPSYDVQWVDKPAPPPWSPPAKQPKTPSMNAPRCLSDQLQVSGFDGNGATGMTFTTIRLRNVSASPCLLIGTPTRVAAQSPGQPDVVATRGLHLGDSGVGGDLQPGKAGYLTVETDRDCKARYSDPSTTYPTKEYSSLFVTLPSGTSFVVQKKFDVLCGLRTGGLGVDQPAPKQPFDARTNLAVAIDVTSHAVPGQTFAYVVVLTNTSSSPVSLKHCPGYTEWINQGEAQEAKASYGLNCSTAPEIEPGQQLRYQMLVDLPDDLDLGSADINWVLQFPGAREGAAPMTIDAQ